MSDETEAVMQRWNLAVWKRMQVESRKDASFDERWEALQAELKARREAFALATNEAGAR